MNAANGAYINAPEDDMLENAAIDADTPMQTGLMSRFFGLNNEEVIQQREQLKKLYKRYGRLLDLISDETAPDGETIAVFGGKGGVGKTLTIAVLSELDHLATQLDTMIIDLNKAQRTLPERMQIKLNHDLLTIADMAENLKMLLQVRKNKLEQRVRQTIEMRNEAASHDIQDEEDVKPVTVNPEKLKNFFLHASRLKYLAHYTKSRLMVIPHGETSNRYFDIRTITAVCKLIKCNIHSLFIDTGNEPFDVFNEAAMRFADKRYFVCLANDNATVKTVLDTMRAYYDRGYENAVKQALICYSQTLSSDTPMTLYEAMLGCVDGDETELLELGIDSQKLEQKIYLLPQNRKLGGSRTSSFEPFSFSPLKRNSVERNKEFVGIRFAIAVAEFRLALLRQPLLTAMQRKEDIDRANKQILMYNFERSGNDEIDTVAEFDIDELLSELIILPNALKEMPVAAIEK